MFQLLLVLLQTDVSLPRVDATLCLHAVPLLKLILKLSQSIILVACKKHLPREGNCM